MSEQELIELAFQMHRRSYIPYSRFPVGAALLCRDGRVFTGCNIENASYGNTVCAERVAAFKAVSEGCRDNWLMLAIAGTSDDYCWPCGPCRQVLYEFCPDLIILAANGSHQYQKVCLSQLLPHAFGPGHLGAR